MTNRTKARATFLAAVVLSACGHKDPDDSTADSSVPIKSTATADSKPAPTTAPTVVDTAPVQPVKPGIDAHVKAELDNRSDGLSGTPLGAPGATASLQTPSTWQTVPKGDVIVAGTTDQKTSVAVQSADSDAKKDAIATALGLTGCQWNTPETVTVGKDKLSASAADGLCSRGSAQISTAYFFDGSDKLLAFGAWDKAGGDMSSVFQSMRATTKIKPGGDASGIGPCCDALRGNARNAPLQQQGFYLAAAGVCDTIRNNPQGRQLLGQVRAALAGANMPASCK